MRLSKHRNKNTAALIRAYMHARISAAVFPLLRWMHACMHACIHIFFGCATYISMHFSLRDKKNNIYIYAVRFNNVFKTLSVTLFPPLLLKRQPCTTCFMSDVRVMGQHLWAAAQFVLERRFFSRMSFLHGVRKIDRKLTFGSPLFFSLHDPKDKALSA